MEEQRRNGKKQVLFAVLLVAVALVSSAVTAFFCNAANRGDAFRPLAQMADTIQQVYYYYDEKVKTEDALVDAALRGMVGSIGDDYAQYYTAEQYAELLQSNSGEYTGLGIVVSMPDEEGSVIQRVYAGGPMEQAGVKAGDLIVRVNGTTVGGLSLDEMLAQFRSDDGPDVFLLRRGTEEFTVTATRAVINVPYVSYELLDNGVGYIRLIGFYGHVVQETKDAIAALTAQGASKLILDLRDNPGGGLNEVLDVADLFLPKGSLIVSIKSRTEDTERYHADGTEVCTLPLAVLVNGGSASASELLSGALQDHGIATIIGTQTFGKGIVQTYFHLSGNEGWVKLTTDAYYTPSDVCIHGVGITPDIVSELSEEYRTMALDSLPREQDSQLQTAIDLLTKGN